MTVYQPPDTPEVEESICIKVLVPKHQRYLSAFWSAYWYFGKWVAWERDGTDRATRAAQVWRPLIEQSRTWYENGECCDMQIRQNPDNLCQLQVSECGEEWVTVADFSGCGNVPPIPYSEPLPDGRSAAEGTIDDMLWWVSELINTIETELTASTPPATVITNLTASTQSQIGLWMQPGIANLVNVMATYTPAERQAEIAALDWESIRDYTVCWVEDVNIAIDTRAWLDKVSDFLFSQFQAASSWLFNALTDAAQFLGLDSGQGWTNAAWSVEGGGVGFGFGNIICGWCVRYDFTTGTHGWLVDDFFPGSVPLQMGTYIAGVGFRSAWITGPQTQEAIGIYRPMGATIQAKKIRIRANAGNGPWGGAVMAFQDDRFVNLPPFLGSAPLVVGESTYEITGDFEFDLLAIHTGSLVDEDQTFIWVEIEGTIGTIPPGGSVCS